MNLVLTNESEVHHKKNNVHETNAFLHIFSMTFDQNQIQFFLSLIENETSVRKKFPSLEPFEWVLSLDFLLQ